MNVNQKIELIANVNVFIGIDIAKHEHYASFIDKNSRVLKTNFKFCNDRKGFEELESAISEFVGQIKEVVISMEPTGHYWKSLGHYLMDKGYMVLLVNPYHVKLSKELRDNQQSKNDRKDSLLIAYLTREGKFLEPIIPEECYANLRLLTNTREMLIKDQTRHKIHLKKLLDEYIPEYDHAFSDTACATSIALLIPIPDQRVRKYNKQNLKATIQSII